MASIHALEVMFGAFAILLLCSIQIDANQYCLSGFQTCNSRQGVCKTNVNSDVHNCGKCYCKCPSPPHSNPTCREGGCGYTCEGAFRDCDSSSRNGCETCVESNPLHCGKCGKRCPVPDANSIATCSHGSCGFKCKPGCQLCNRACVDVENHVSNCGECGVSCPAVANAIATCSDGRCLFSCKFFFANCDGKSSNGCEVNTLTDAAHCGSCRASCPTVANAVSTCSASQCSFTCKRGFANCDGKSSNGCEVDTSSDAVHCGSCGASCPTVTNAVSTCSASLCIFACNTGFANCDGDPSNGCEVNTSLDTANCGSCGAACPTVAHAVSTCSDGQCSFTCNAGFANCDGDPSTGCEVNLLSHTNCGSCGASCEQYANSVITCSDSQCGFTCDRGFGNCDGDPSTGCEADTTSDTTNCGSCGASCPTAAYAVPTCSDGQCGFTCYPAFANCDGDPSNGCEVDITLDAANCGSCGASCPTVADAVSTCSGSECSFTCNPGFANCDGDPSNGCEVDLTSTLNCGSCGHVCPAANAHAHATCSAAGHCGISCDGGFADCNGDPSDGCETNIASDNTNCGSCGCSCAVVVGSSGNPNIANTFCSGGQCTIQCSSAACTCDSNGCNCNNGLTISCSSLPSFIGLCNAPAGP